MKDTALQAMVCARPARISPETWDEMLSALINEVIAEERQRAAWEEKIARLQGKSTEGGAR